MVRLSSTTSTDACWTGAAVGPRDGSYGGGSTGWVFIGMCGLRKENSSVFPSALGRNSPTEWVVCVLNKVFMTLHKSLAIPFSRPWLSPRRGGHSFGFRLGPSERVGILQATTVNFISNTVFNPEYFHFTLTFDLDHALGTSRVALIYAVPSFGAYG